MSRSLADIHNIYLRRISIAAAFVPCLVALIIVGILATIIDDTKDMWRLAKQRW